MAAARELYGLTLYRQGKWKPAIKELEAFRLLTGSTEQHPVLADCYRALGNRAMVDELWEELRAQSPSAELVTEGRIVVAGASPTPATCPPPSACSSRAGACPKRPQEHHLRRAYALADLYERAGDVARARELFSRLVAADPDFADARMPAAQRRLSPVPACHTRPVGSAPTAGPLPPEPPIAWPRIPRSIGSL